jgi:hypothetical protein
MKQLLILAILATTLTVNAQTKSTEVSLGKDASDVAWFTSTTFPSKVMQRRYMTAMYTTPQVKGSHIVVYVEVDCSDNTIRLHGMDSYTNLEKVDSLTDVTRWARPKGVAIKLYQSVCGTRVRGQIS